MTASSGTCTVHYNQNGNPGYNPAPEITQPVTAQKRTLTVTGITASDKVYNSSTSATPNTTAASLVGNIDGGNVSLNKVSAVGIFSDKNVGNGKVVSISGLTISGSAAGKYNLVQPTTTANITPATLTYTADPATRVYGASNPTFTGTVSGFVGGETQVGATTGSLVFSSSANASSPVGSYDITGSGLTANFGNYSFAQAAGNATALTVTKANQTITFPDISNKTYGDSDFSAGASASSGLTVSLDASGSCTASGGTIHIVSAGDCTVTATQAGDTNHNPATPVSHLFTVNQKSVTATVIADNKTYDATASAMISSCTIPAKVGSDDVGCTAASASFADKTVANGKTVMATGITLTGSTAGNYALSSTSATASANITQKDLTVTATGVNKAYDGTTSGTATLQSSDIFSGDHVDITGTAVFASSTVATGISVHVSGIAIGGADAANYHLTNTDADTTANITQSVGTIVLDKSALSFVYDGTAKSVAVSSVTPDGLPYVTTYNANSTPPKDANTYAVFASILDANYAGTDNATLVISPAPLTVSATSSSKVYGQIDPAFGYSVTSGTLFGTDALAGSLTRDGGEDVGAYAIKQGTLAAGTNYNLSFIPATFTITKAEQTISFLPITSKVFPGPDFDLDATASSSVPVTFAILDASSSCSLVGSKTLHLTATGTCAVTAQDAASQNYNAAPDVTQTLDILPADLVPPVITLAEPTAGTTTLTMKVGTAFVEPGATAHDEVSGDVPVTSDASSTVATTTPGTYTVTYTASDYATPPNTATTTRTVIVRPLGTDSSLSALSISSGVLSPAFASSTFAYHATLPYDSEGIPAISATTTDSNATYGVVSSGGVTGTSIITVTAEDGVATSTYTINYSVAAAPDTIAPVITILGSNPATVTVGTTYTDAGATSTDNVDGDLTSKIVASSTVNANVVGTYAVVYSVSDTAGNSASSTRTVNVVAANTGGHGGGGGGGGLALLPSNNTAGGTGSSGGNGTTGGTSGNSGTTNPTTPTSPIPPLAGGEGTGGIEGAGVIGGTGTTGGNGGSGFFAPLAAISGAGVEEALASGTSSTSGTSTISASSTALAAVAGSGILGLLTSWWFWLIVILILLAGGALRWLI